MATEPTTTVLDSFHTLEQARQELLARHCRAELSDTELQTQTLLVATQFIYQAGLLLRAACGDDTPTIRRTLLRGTEVELPRTH